VNVTFVVSSLAAGGAQRVMSLLANHWAQAGYRVTILAFSRSGVEPFFPLDSHVQYVPIGIEGESSNLLKGISNNLRRITHLRRAIRVSTPQVVISFMDQENVLTVLATRRLGVPVIVSVRVDPLTSTMGGVWRFLRNRVYPFANRIVVQTCRVRESFPQKLQDKVVIIPNPVLSPPPVTCPRLPASTHSMIAIGRLTEQKGFDLLIAAFSELSPRHPDWRLTILGDGPLRPELERLRDQLGLTGLIDFPGEVKQIHQYLEQADVFVLSSRYEGFPNSLCEAMACGLAVVATDCRSGPGEIIEDGINGLLAIPDNVHSLASCMDRLMSNEVERIRLGNNASRITERFGSGKVFEMWESLAKEVIQEA
jgi:GalNAc-alpha-(1->4)-GalNAc-alpha-(1->3)-diNAcBac-PP-undecaprenol alpha-1,4-N-acetyl-D-galactosaminyltransferase